jgi:hypothetical protein
MLQPAPRHAPSRLKSTADLRTLQRLMVHAIVRPLAAGDRTPSRWIDQKRSTAAVIGEFIKPNDRLTAVERIEIYHRVYWYRLIGAATDDCPGLQALLGEKRFERMIRAYLAKYPSESFTLRNLCARLLPFLRAEPRWTKPHRALALAIARFEWAQTEAFDGPTLPPLTPAIIQRTPPHRLKLRLQPYITLLELAYPVDTYVLAVKERNALRSAASNAQEVEGEPQRPRRSNADGRRPARPKRLVPIPKPAKTYLAVHRYENCLYYKRLDRAQFRIVQALGSGKTIAQALAAAGRPITPAEAQEWFSLWMKLGWWSALSPTRAKRSP